LFAPITAYALEESPTREAYTASVEPICKANRKASDRLLKPVKKLVKRDRLPQAARAFAKAAKALESTQRKLAKVPQPPSDTARLRKWLTEIKGEVALMRKISKNFKQGQKSKATSLAVKLQNNATKANNRVIVFSFHYCRIDPATYA
jgi:hypothetical protein